MLRIGIVTLFYIVISDAFGGFYLAFGNNRSENSISFMTSDNDYFYLCEMLLLSISLILIMIGGYKDKRSEDDLSIRYSFHYRSQKLLSLLLVWIAYEILFSSYFDILINPLGNFISFTLLMILYSFTHFFELKINEESKSLKCIRSGMVTSNIKGIEKFSVNKEKVLFHTADGGEYHLDLNKFHTDDANKIKEFSSVCI